MWYRWRCPQCGHNLGWFERAKLSPWGMRRIIPCPSCKQPLEWSKWPHRLIMFGSLTLLIVGLVSLSAEQRFIHIAVFVAAGMTLLGVCLNKVNCHTPNKSSN